VKSASPPCILTALTALIATAAIAQTATQTPAQPPPNYAPPPPSPGQSAPAQSPGATNPRNADTQGDPNDCASQLKASNPRLSAVEIKQYCQRQLNPSAPQD
jgi:hypothetical protein